MSATPAVWQQHAHNESIIQSLNTSRQAVQSASRPIYDTNVLARTLPWTDHNNPHWPMQSYDAAVIARGLHRDCPAMTCATQIAAHIKIGQHKRALDGSRKRCRR